MYVCRCDANILTSNDAFKMQKEYEQKFGRRFLPFNYDDFDGTDDKCAAQIWKEELEKCLRENHPTTMESRAFEFFGH